MMRKLLIIGLDCLGTELLSPSALADLPNLRGLVEAGLSGPLESTLPPITVPAWTSMLSGRDPGELGIYGFRNRRSFAYGDLVLATSQSVRFPRVWDYVGRAGGRSIVLGVPQTSPPPSVRGVLVSGFESQKADAPFTYPASLEDEVRAVVGDYQFDVDDFRNVPRECVLEQTYKMTSDHFGMMEHLLHTREWDFAMLCEIGPDRMHHCFWSDHDPAHPRHDPASPHRETIRRYYSFLDRQLGRLLAQAGPDATILIASDHGARPMHGGVCINEVLRQAGWLVLKEEPRCPTKLDPEMVDWTRTRAWGEGGYYARIFLNIKGREPEGIIPPAQRDDARRELSALLASLPLPGGPTLINDVVWPEQAYRRVRGLAPELLVFFGDLSWRSLGTVGHGTTWLVSNDTGLDEANHARDGIYALAGPGITARRESRASILDIAPTALHCLGLSSPPELAGKNMLSANGWLQ